MKMKFESEKWLEEFVGSRSEGAFRNIVSENCGLVFATAMRKLNGDRGAAEEVMQEVFVSLVGKARVLLEGGVAVGPWLYRQTCRKAANRVRGEARRRSREGAYGAMGASGESTSGRVLEEIDDVLSSLKKSEQELVICRYVEERDYAEIGKRFGFTSEAARKRIARAVEKMRKVLEKRGVTVSTSALAVMLVGMSGSKASAVTIAEVSRVALNKGVMGGAGALSIGGILRLP